MKLIDISLPITEKTVVWENEFQPEIKELSSIENGESSNSSSIEMNLHTGTHIDFPKHFFSSGKAQENFSISKFYGEVYVAEIKDDPISDDALNKAKIPQNASKLLLKTQNSKLYRKGVFSKSFNALNEKGGYWIIERGIELVGIDYLSIEKYGDENYPVHKLLLKNNILIIEGLNLEDVDEGFYTLFALPLKVLGRDAAPVRAFLMKEK